MNDIRLITPEDGEWPIGLNQLEDAPKRLWVRGSGSLAILTEDRAVAIVGARACTAYGQHVATDLGYGVASEGWTVVSGGAFGIDIAAHRGAMLAPGPSVVVLACGVDRAYPAAHVQMFDTIAREGGLIVSEYPPGSDASRSQFLARNRIIAALSLGMVLVEASKRSGSMSAFAWARSLRRRLMVVPGPVTSTVSEGTLLELKERDTHPVATAADVIEVLL